MSINHWLQVRVNEQRLFPLVPLAKRARKLRKMYLAEELNSFLESPEGAPDWEDRIGQLRADLDQFVDGTTIDPKYLFLLYPAHEGVWEIRSVRPHPSIRVLGLFAARNTFVATHYALREDLGGWNSRAWRDAKLTARTKWRNLFHTYRPLVSTNITDLVSGAIDARYFK